MQDSNAPPNLSPEIQTAIEALSEGKAIAQISQIVQNLVNHQLEAHLIDFERTIAQSNAATIELMQQELERIKNESATVKGALQRLSSAVAPNIPANAEVVTFRQAIQNLETCGSILPSDAEIATAQLKFQRNHAWSLFRQSLAKIIIRKLEETLCKPQTSTEPTGTTKRT
jgi:isocitrate/isopropylmalate dehydrogenase